MSRDSLASAAEDSPRRPAPRHRPVEEQRNERLAGLLLFLCALGVYAATLPHTVTLEDSGEFITVAWSGGIAHPPGFPLYTLLGRAFANLPLGTVATRIHLLSAAAGAAACVAVYCVGLRTSRGIPSALAAGGLTAFSALFWPQAIVAEVYSLHALIYFTALALAWRVHDDFSRGGARALALLCGVGLANHWPLLLLGLPAVALLLVGHRRALTRDAPVLGALAALGPCLYLTLLIAPGEAGRIDAWGPVPSVAALLEYVARARYASVESSMTAGVVDSSRFALDFARASLGQFGWPLAPVILVGIVAAWQRLERLAFAALAWGLASSSWLLLLFLRWDYDDLHREVFTAYQVVPAGIAALFAGFGVVWLAERVTREGALRAHVLRLFAAAAVLGALGFNLADNDLRRESLAADYARAVLESLPDGATLLVNADMDAAPIAYLQRVEGLRTDVDVISRTGYLFGTRLADSAVPGWEQRASKALARIIEERGRIFDTEIGHSKLVTSVFTADGRREYRSAFTVVDHGLYHQIATRRVHVDSAPRLAAATRALDREAAGGYREHWRYLKELVLGKFCQTLLLSGRDEHPALRSSPHCSHLLARHLALRGQFGEASALLGALLASGNLPPKPQHQRLYNDFFLVEIQRIGIDDPAAVRDELQALADRVRPALDLYPLCDNAVLPNLLILAEIASVDIGFSDWRAKFADCPALRGDRGQSPDPSRGS